jgi:hypothetical protein
MPSLTKSGKPRKVRSDKGKKRGPAPTGRYVRGGRKFMLGGGITNIPVPVYGAVVPSTVKRTRGATRKGRPSPMKGYTRPAYKFMKSGGITNIPVPNYSTMAVGKPRKSRAPRSPSAYNIFVKRNYQQVKSRNPTLSSKQVMSKVAQEWNAIKKNMLTY